LSWLVSGAFKTAKTCASGSVDKGATSVPGGRFFHPACARTQFPKSLVFV
jgi:hypothetical protein